MTTHIDIDVQCVRCRNRHKESDRLSIPGNGINTLVCPRCSCKSFYDIRPQAAWCWASGLIEIGDEADAPEGAIVIARGERAFVISVIGILSRRGRDASEGRFLVPGVPEAANQREAADALAKWLAWCAKGNGHKGRHGVKFVTERQAEPA